MLKKLFLVFMLIISSATSYAQTRFVKSDYKMEKAQKNFCELYAQLHAKNNLNIEAKELILSTQNPLFLKNASALTSLIETLESRPDDQEAQALLANINCFFYYSLRKLISSLDLTPEICARLLNILKTLYAFEIPAKETFLPAHGSFDKLPAFAPTSFGEHGSMSGQSVSARGEPVEPYEPPFKPFASTISRTMICLGISGSLGTQVSSEEKLKSINLFFSTIKEHFEKQKTLYPNAQISGEDTTLLFQTLQTAADMSSNDTLTLKDEALNDDSEDKSFGYYVVHYGIPIVCSMAIMVLIVLIVKQLIELRAKKYAVNKFGNAVDDAKKKVVDAAEHPEIVTEAAVVHGVDHVVNVGKPVARFTGKAIFGFFKGLAHVITKYQLVPVVVEPHHAPAPRPAHPAPGAGARPLPEPEDGSVFFDAEDHLPPAPRTWGDTYQSVNRGITSTGQGIKLFFSTFLPWNTVPGGPARPAPVVPLAH